MNGKLRSRLDSIETELRRLAKAAENHPTAADLDKVHAAVKDARGDLQDLASGTRASLDANTAALASVMKQAAEVVAGPVKDAAPAAAKKANGRAAATPTTPAAPATKEQS